MGFLTHGASNFRVKRATTLPYKGQRKTNEDKPHFYDEIRDYLQTEFGFQMMYGIEADDALTIVSEWYKDDPKVSTVIATKDKDLWQYAGEHYNMNKDELMFISESQGHYNLCKQMILGDMGTDNIPGLSHAGKWEIYFKSDEAKKKYRPLTDHQYGEKTAEKLLHSWDPKDYFQNILELYISEYWDEDFGEDRFYETFDLVFMLRELPKGVKLDKQMYKIKNIKVEYETLTVSNEFEDI